MCGIAGIVGLSDSQTIVSSMVDKIIHRGPDFSGQVNISDLPGTLGHVRLSIIDLDPRSNQPFVSMCGRYFLSFNGEIYNFLQLKVILEQKGYHFKTSSDTEVLLYWLIENGVEGLQDLEGMFAFGFVDKLERTLLLARDQIGEKPLYYSLFDKEARKVVAFASEIKAIKVIPEIDTSIDEEGLADYLRFLYTAAPHTLYKGIRELPPGHYLNVNIDQPKENVIKFYDIENQILDSSDISYEDAVSDFRSAFLESMKLRLQSDVPLGIYLSGGLDSNAILASARQLNLQADLETFTIKYGGSSLANSVNESELAKRAAEVQGALNNQILFSNELDFMSAVHHMVDIFDQPFGNSTSVVAEKIAENVSKFCRVALVGDGGDEVLAGYPRYKALPIYQRFQFLPQMVKKGVALGVSPLPERGSLSTRIRRIKQFANGLAKPIAVSFLEWSTYISTDTLNNATGRTQYTKFYSDLLETFNRYHDDPIRGASIVDLKSFVPYNLMQAADRTSMTHALELRCPFLSPKVVELALNLPSNYKIDSSRNKPILIDSMSDSIPDFISKQPKRAFNPPIQELIRKNYKILHEYLLSKNSLTSTLVSKQFINEELEKFRLGKKDNSTLLWGLASLECWLRVEH